MIYSPSLFLKTRITSILWLLFLQSPTVEFQPHRIPVKHKIWPLTLTAGLSLILFILKWSYSGSDNIALQYNFYTPRQRKKTAGKLKGSGLTLIPQIITCESQHLCIKHFSSLCCLQIYETLKLWRNIWMQKKNLHLCHFFLMINCHLSEFKVSEVFCGQSRILCNWLHDDRMVHFLTIFRHRIPGTFSTCWQGYWYKPVFDHRDWVPKSSLPNPGKRHHIWRGELSRRKQNSNGPSKLLT